MSHAQFRSFTCTQKWCEIAGVYSFIFARDDLQAINFKPGQFVLLKAHIGMDEVVRCYSIASSLGQSEIKLTVQAVEGGTMSTWLNRHVDVGDQVEISSPMGEMTLAHARETDQIVMASVGCGIVPMMSLLKEALCKGDIPNIHFIYCAKDDNHIIYRDELIALERCNDKLNLTIYLKHASSTIHTAKVARFGSKQVEMLMLSPERCVVYLCGPERFTTEIAGHFEAIGVAKEKLLYESYGFLDENLGVLDENLGENIDESDSVYVESSQDSLNDTVQTVSVNMPVFNHYKVVKIGTNLKQVLDALHAPKARGHCNISNDTHFCHIKVTNLASGQVSMVNACQYPIEHDISVTLL